MSPYQVKGCNFAHFMLSDEYHVLKDFSLHLTYKIECEFAFSKILITSLFIYLIEWKEFPMLQHAFFRLIVRSIFSLFGNSDALISYLGIYIHDLLRTIALCSTLLKAFHLNEIYVLIFVKSNKGWFNKNKASYCIKFTLNH